MKKQTSTALLAASLGLTLSLALLVGLSLLAGAVQAAGSGRTSPSLEPVCPVADASRTRKPSEWRAFRSLLRT